MFIKCPGDSEKLETIRRLHIGKRFYDMQDYIYFVFWGGEIRMPSLIDRFLLEEDKLDLWNFQDTKGFPFWSLLRRRLLSNLRIAARKYNARYLAEPALGKWVFSQLRIKLITLKHFFFPGTYDALFVIGGVNVKNTDSGPVDRLHTGYIARFINPLVLQTPCNQRVLNAYGHKALCDFQLILIIIYLISFVFRLNPIDSENLAQLTRAVNSRMISLKPYGQKVDYNWSKTLFRRYLATSLLLTLFLNRATIKNRIAFIEDASYLSHLAPFTFLLKKNGFKVIECQHGMVSQNHVAYNYPPGVINNGNNPARRCLPDHFLTFGKAWSDMVRIPGQTYEIGLEYLENKVADPEGDKACIDKSICIVSQGTITAILVATAIDLATHLPDYRIFYKLHPGETGFTKRYIKLYRYKNIKVLKNGDPYLAVARCKFIVGHSSTLLAEAAAFTDKNIYYLQNPDFPEGIGIPFSETVDLARLIRARTPTTCRLNLWARDSANRVSEFFRYLDIAPHDNDC